MVLNFQVRNGAGCDHHSIVTGVKDIFYTFQEQSSVNYVNTRFSSAESPRNIVAFCAYVLNSSDLSRNVKERSSIKHSQLDNEI